MNGSAARDDIGDDQEVRGLSGERTDLAWSRSGLAFVVCIAALAKHLAPDLTTLEAPEIVVIALAVGGISWVFAVLWARAVAATTLSGRRIADAGKLRLIAVGTAAIGCAAVVVALLPDH